MGAAVCNATACVCCRPDSPSQSYDDPSGAAASGLGVAASKRAKAAGKADEPCLGCGLSIAGPHVVECLGTSDEDGGDGGSKRGKAGAAGADGDDYAGAAGGGGREGASGGGSKKTKSHGRGLCDLFEEHPDSVIPVYADLMWVLNSDIKPQVRVVWGGGMVGQAG